MVAVAATAAFAFTTPKSSAFDGDVYHFNGTVWEQGTGSGCTGSSALCQFTTLQDVDDAALADIASKIVGNGTQQVQNIDHDNDPQTAAIPVDVTNILRFP